MTVTTAMAVGFAAAVLMHAVRRQVDHVAVAHAALGDDVIGELLHIVASPLENWLSEELRRLLLSTPFQTSSGMSGYHNQGKGENMMGKLAITLAAAALMLGSLTFAATAQTQQPGASSIHGLAQNATPIVKQAACNGRWGPWCPPGRHRVCGPYRCWCAACW